MMLASSAMGFAPTAPVAAPVTSVSRAAAPAMETKADLVALAEKLNPVVGFWDPMGLAEYDQWSQGEEAAIGFLRHAEIKHGRIAMFAFVGYVVQSNGIHWPWNIESSGLSFADISAAGSPPEQWDALSSAAKAQCLLAEINNGRLAMLGIMGFLAEQKVPGSVP